MYWSVGLAGALVQEKHLDLARLDTIGHDWKCLVLCVNCSWTVTCVDLPQKGAKGQNKPVEGLKTGGFGPRNDAKPELWTEGWSFGVME